MTNLDRLVTVDCPRHHLPADDRDGDYIWQCDICREETKLMRKNVKARMIDRILISPKVHGGVNLQVVYIEKQPLSKDEWI